MTETWEDVLFQSTAESWLSAISENIPKRVKQLLPSHRPATVAEVGALLWKETSNAGVYGWILKPRAELYLDKQVHLHVGSASKYGFGLEGEEATTSFQKQGAKQPTTSLTHPEE
jgi:hypothetical protein